MGCSRRRLVQAGLAGSIVAAASPALAAAPSHEEAARAALRRLFGDHAKAFHLQLEADGAAPWFQVGRRGARTEIRANSPVALVRGAYDRLKASGSAYVGWDGRRCATPPPAPHRALDRQVSPFRRRAYLNPCTYGYTAAFWDWPRWEAEIDWMAAHGADMPLALEGQEWVWRELWRGLGVSDKALAGYFCGPAFLPWARMGNIESYRGPLPDAWFEKKRALQHQILGRMRALGMEPVLPAFSGYAPKAFAARHPEARFYRMIPWGGFHETYWLDPSDPLFAKLAKGFADLYAAEYGEGRYFLADAFNEMLPPVSAKPPERQADGFFAATEPDHALAPSARDEQLSRYGAELYRAIVGARPDAVWVMQGWMFSFQKDFWAPEAVRAFLRDVPAEHLLILDLANDAYPGGWSRNHAYDGKPWIFGYVHNFGGNNPLTGDLDLYRQDLSGLPTRPDHGQLQGVGVFPEGLNTNPVVYEYLFDQAWRPSAAPVNTWLKGYARARYGKTSPAMDAAWAGLHKTFYQSRNWDFAWRDGFGTYVFCKRPKLELAEARHKFDLAAAKRSVEAFVDLWPSYGASPLYRNDAVAAVSHLASLWMDERLSDAIGAFQHKDVATGDRAWAGVQATASELDHLLGVLPQGLDQWVTQARRYGSSEAESAYYVDSALAQVTVWGGDNVLADYASKAWQGLYADFYLPRWRLFLTRLKSDGAALDKAAMAADLAAWEHAWIKRQQVAPRRIPKDPQRLARTILNGLHIS